LNCLLFLSIHSFKTWHCYNDKVWCFWRLILNRLSDKW
jgi:hypothetical protein